jgi:hypothetical protein
MSFRKQPEEGHDIFRNVANNPFLPIISSANLFTRFAGTGYIPNVLYGPK